MDRGFPSHYNITFPGTCGINNDKGFLPLNIALPIYLDGWGGQGQPQLPPPGLICGTEFKKARKGLVLQGPVIIDSAEKFGGIVFIYQPELICHLVTLSPVAYEHGSPRTQVIIDPVCHT